MMEVRPIAAPDHEWVANMLQEAWGAEIVVSRGRIHKLADLPGLMVTGSGILTYHIEGDECEIVTIDSFTPSKGIGTLLIKAMIEVARSKNCQRLWLITTNDNTAALRFYQKNGFHLAALHTDAIKYSRQLKPQIPEIGLDGIPIRDEIELEIIL